MIQVYIHRNRHGEIEEFQIEGHAGYGEPGEDIVCAAVSAISIGMVNAVEMVLGIRLPAEVKEDGFLRCRLPAIADEAIRGQVQLLLEAMVAALRSVAAEYGEYVQIRTNHRSDKTDGNGI